MSAAAVLVSSCKGRVFTTLRAQDAAWLRFDVLDLAAGEDLYGPALVARCAVILREIHRGRGAEFAGLMDVPTLTRRLLEIGTIANEAGAGIVSWR